MASGKKSTCSSSDLLESGGRSLCALELFWKVLRRQAHTLSYKRDIDRHLPFFALGFSSLTGLSYLQVVRLAARLWIFFQLECLFSANSVVSSFPYLLIFGFNVSADVV